MSKIKDFYKSQLVMYQHTNPQHHQNRPFDGIRLPKFSRATGNGRHANHPNYNNYVNKLLQQSNNKPALESVIKIVSDLRNQIENSNCKINDLHKSVTTPADNTQVVIMKQEIKK